MMEIEEEDIYLLIDDVCTILFVEGHFGVFCPV